MKRKYNEFYIGLAVTITILIVIASILYLQKNNFLQNGMTVNLVVQNAKGIRKGGNVLYRGLEVGSVQNTQLVSDGVLIKLKITRTDSIPADSRFKISTNSLIGSPSVKIIPGKSQSILKNNAYVKEQSGVGFSDIYQQINNITENINRMVNNVDTLTNKDTRLKVKNALGEIDKSVQLIHSSLQNNLKGINDIIGNMKQITADNKAPIDSIINRLSEHSKQITSAIDNTEKITSDLNKILSGIESGKGTAGKLLTNDELYNKINNTVTNLNSLIKDIKEHPDKYLHISIF